MQQANLQVRLSLMAQADTELQRFLAHGTFGSLHKFRDL
jgi:hypothetical protein